MLFTRPLRRFLIGLNHGITCIGDSHSSFFSGQERIQRTWPKRSRDRWPFFHSYRIGPALAYNLTRTGTTSRGREKLFEVLHDRVAPGRRVLLCFGEIDCRAHLVKQVRSQQTPPETVAASCVNQYFQVVQEVHALGFQVMVWNVVPPTLMPSEQSEFPIIGSFTERMAITRHFNSSLQIRCHQTGIPFVSIFDALLDEQGLPDARYFPDKIHLGPQAIPLAVRSLQPFCPEINFAPFDAVQSESQRRSA